MRKVTMWSLLAVLSLASGMRAQEGAETLGLAEVRGRLVELYSGRAGGELGERGKAAMADLQQQVRKLMARVPITPDPDPADADNLGYEVSRLIGNLLVMAQAYVAADSELKGSPELLAKIESELRRSLQWIAPGKPRPGNWYPWRISTPQDLGPLLVLLRDKIDAKLLKECRDALAGLMEELSLNGANGVWEARNHVYLALLDGDERHLGEAYNYFLSELTVHEASGILEDYSFQFHGRLPHTAGYGGGFARSAAEMIYLAEGSRWAAPAAKRRLLADHLVEHARWVVVGDRYDLSVKGRGVLSNGRADGHLEALLLLKAMKTKDADNNQGAPRDGVPEAADEMTKRFGDKAAFEVAGLADQLFGYHDSPLQGFRMFYVSDLAVFRARNFYTSVRMYSNRLIDYEGNWGMNLKGWFLCYGLTYISRTGNELWADPATLRDHLDWDRLPGTTTRVGVHPAQAYNRGTSPFAGGAGYNHYGFGGGVCGFILQPAAGDFTARKSYHFFDRGFVALGSGITSTKPHDEHVVTTVLQWAMPDATQTLYLSGDRKAGAIDGEAVWENVSWAWIDNVECVFPEPVTLHGHRRGNLITLWLDHGNAPRDASYAYIVLPNVSPEDFKRFPAEPTVRVRQQDATAHAVETKDGETGIVFWQAGTAGAVTASAAAVVHLIPGTESLDLAVSNPLHTEARLELGIARRPKTLLFGLAPEASVRPRDDGLRVTVNTAAGRIYRMNLGGETVAQQPRLDNLAWERFRIQAESEGDTTWITAWIPEEAAKEEGGYRLVIRGSQGHLRKELTVADRVELPADLTAKGEKNAFRYKWVRQGEKVQSGEFSVSLITKLHMAIEGFTVPAARTPLP